MNFKNILNRKKREVEKERTERTNNSFKLKGLFVIGLIMISLLPISVVGESPYFIEEIASDKEITDDKYSSNIIHINNTTSIQSAVNKAQPGDTILLDGGQYQGEGNFNIVISTDNISLKSSGINGNPVINLTDRTDRKYGIVIGKHENVTIDGLNIIGAFYGIIFRADVTNSTIKNCNIIESEGIGIQFSSAITNCTVQNSNITDGDYGIEFAFNSNSNSIISSNISNNGYGINAFNSSSNSIISSNISNNRYGINYDDTINNSVIGCDIVNNTYVGISIGSRSHGAIIQYNRICDNSGDITTDLKSDVVDFGDSSDISFNWWGGNNISYKGENLPENHYVVQLSANGLNTTTDAYWRFLPDTNVNLRYRLVLNTTGEVADNKLPYFTVNNIVNDKSSILDARNEYEYSQKIIYPNSFTLESILDNEDITLQIRPEFIPPPPEDPLSDVYVSVKGDDENNKGDTSERPVATVNHALSLVESGGTVHILTDLNIVETIDVNKSITIKGEDSNGISALRKLDGLNQNGIMLINPNLNVSIERIIFQNAEVNGDGGAIGNNRSSLYINQCIFRNNHASGYGGAICSVQDQSDDSNELFFPWENKDKTMFPQISILPIPQKLNSSKELKIKELKIINSTFENNNASNSSAIYNTVFSFNLTNCDFINNTIDHNRNAILSFTHDIYMENCNSTSDFDAIEDNKLYTDLLLYNFNSSSKDKGEYLKTGCFKIGNKEKDNFEKNGFYDIYYENSEKFLRFNDLEQEIEDTDTAMFYAKGECEKFGVELNRVIVFDPPNPNSQQLIDEVVVGGEVEEGLPAECCAKFAAFRKTWYGRIMINLLGAGVTGLIWLIDFLSATEDIETPTFLNVVMDNTNAFVGDEITVRLVLEYKNDNNSYVDIPDGKYVIGYDKYGDGKLFDQEFEFKDGHSEFKYIVPTHMESFIALFSRYKYNHTFKKDYYYAESKEEKSVNWMRIPTITTIFTDATNPSPGDTIQVKFNINEDKPEEEPIPINNGNYNLSIVQTDSADPTTMYTNISVDNGTVTVNYRVKNAPEFDFMELRGIFSMSNKYNKSVSDPLRMDFGVVKPPKLNMPMPELPFFPMPKRSSVFI
ncbi:MAG: right-handed parallel beta-helix repeat-containing protein [Methanobrevibacter sp.]|jgi:hypothetical protein|nr:right-handed parallel beta-helix repeat-containing protein [Candidatus Methanovirga meridionalis]